MEVQEIESPQLMITTSGETGETGTGSGTVGDTTPDLVRRRRGTWGDLWK